ncbi:MAG: hypothetical protein ACOCP8_06325 [archaeon]
MGWENIGPGLWYKEEDNKYIEIKSNGLYKIVYTDKNNDNKKVLKDDIEEYKSAEKIVNNKLF